VEASRRDRGDVLMPGRREPLTPARAAELYREGMSACQIAEAYGITRGGAEARIRAGGLGGLQWCPVHRAYEELQIAGPTAAPSAAAQWGAVDAPEWRGPLRGDA
jgi:hypothetical protein